MSGPPERDRERGLPIERLAVVGATFRTVGFEGLGELTLAPGDVVGRARLQAALGAEELVDLATCNRVEHWVVLPHARSADGLSDALAAHLRATGRTPPGPEGLFACAGQAALEHLFRVACGLDSLVLGETEITGQLRRAVEVAVAERTAGPILREVFDRALACGRRARAAAEAVDAPGPASAAAMAIEKLRQHFGAEGPGASVIVGVGPMSVEVARALATGTGERLFVNRTPARAAELAARFGGRSLSLEAFLAAPPAALDLLFTATSAEAPVLGPAVFAPALAARRARGDGRPIIVCDMGVPRDVDRAVDALPGVLVVALEHMEALAHARRRDFVQAATRAAEVVAAEVGRVAREERFRALAGESARAVLEGRLAHLDAGDRALILRFATGLASRFARQPEVPAGDAERLAQELLQDLGAAGPGG